MRHRRQVGVLFFAVSALFAACTPESLPPLDLPEGCNPLLAGVDCMLPYPSNYFLQKDAQQPSGHKVVMGRAAVLLTKDGHSAEPTDFSDSDGFSVIPTILTVLGSAVSPDNCVGIRDDLQASKSLDSPTLLIDADSAELIAHFVDFDARASDALHQALIIRPAHVLQHQHRYIVALHALRDPQQKLISAPEGFRRLRDAQSDADPQLQAMQEHYDTKIFAPLEHLGLQRDKLQLAWDFTTDSAEAVTRDMFDARALALDALQQDPVQVEQINYVEGESPEVWRRIQGKLRVPLVLEHDGPGAQVSRDADGKMQINGDTLVPFTIIVPSSLKRQYTPGFALEYGHGAFSSQVELTDGRLTGAMDSMQSVGFAVDWWGMSDVDVGVVVADVGEDVWRTMRFSGRLPQAMVNWLALNQAIREVFVHEDALRRPLDADADGVVVDPDDPQHNNAGALLYEPAQVGFWGASQGGILGGVLSVLDPHIQSSVLHVAAGGWTHIMSRSIPFARFLFLMDLSVEDPLQEQKLIAALQMYFDRFDPAVYAPWMQHQELPYGPPGQAATRQVLLQIVTGDSHVPNFASYIYARSLGLPLLTPSVRSPSLIDEVSAPYTGSALSIFDMGQDDSFELECRPPDEGNPVHSHLRAAPEAREQIIHFLRSGEIENPCAPQACFIGD